MILIFVYIGTGILVGGYCTHALWVISGENQAKRIRQLYIHSILRQDMSCKKPFFLLCINQEKKACLSNYYCLLM